MFCFSHSGEYEVMACFSFPIPITFRRKLHSHKIHELSVTRDSVNQVTVPTIYSYENDLTCITKTIGTPDEDVHLI